jgi:hypothetical protein
MSVSTGHFCWDLATKSDIVDKIDVESKSESKEYKINDLCVIEVKYKKLYK